MGMLFGGTDENPRWDIESTNSNNGKKYIKPCKKEKNQAIFNSALKCAEAIIKSFK